MLYKKSQIKGEERAELREDSSGRRRPFVSSEPFDGNRIARAARRRCQEFSERVTTRHRRASTPACLFMAANSTCGPQNIGRQMRQTLPPPPKKQHSTNRKGGKKKESSSDLLSTTVYRCRQGSFSHKAQYFTLAKIYMQKRTDNEPKRCLFHQIIVSRSLDRSQD